MKTRGIRPFFALPTVRGVGMGRYKGGTSRIRSPDGNATVSVLQWEIGWSALAMKNGKRRAVITLRSAQTHVNSLPLERSLLDDRLRPSERIYRRRMARALESMRALGAEALDVVIDSEGGAVASARGIAKALKAWHGPKRLLIDGACSSAATMILCMPRWDCVCATLRSHMTVHSAQVSVYGRSLSTGKIYLADARSGESNRELEKLYRKRTGRKKEIIRKWMEEGRTFRGAEIAVAGFADEMKPRTEWEREGLE